MRSEFWEYYPLSDPQRSELIANGLVVLDANALVHVYRLAPSTARAWLDFLDHLSDRVWVPHRAALEYQRRRLDAAAGQNRLARDIEKIVERAVNQVRADINKRSADVKRSRVFDLRALQEAVEKTGESVLHLAEKAHSQSLDLDEAAASEDEMHVRLSDLLDGSIGAAMTDEDVTRIVKEGRDRYKNEVPPGFKDAGKDPEIDRYGDLLIWTELLEKAASASRPVVFITEERKEDWLRTASGRNLGPLPALRREFHSKVEKPFWIYSVAQFLSIAQDYGHTVDPEAITDAQNVERTEAEAPEAGGTQSDRIGDLVHALDRLADPSIVPDDRLRGEIGNLLGSWLTTELRLAAEPLRGPAVGDHIPDVSQ